MALPLELYGPADPRMLNVSIEEKKNHVELGANPVGKSWCSPLEFWSEGMSPAVENHTSFEKQLLMFCGVLVDRDCPTVGTK